MPLLYELHCSLSCARGNDEDEACGGLTGSALYKRLPRQQVPDDDEPTPDPPNPNAAPAEYEYHGCYTDDVAHRVLGQGFGDDAMTPAKCAAACPGAAFIGLEWARECWCGPELDPLSTEVDSGECNGPCSGDETFLCGSDVRLTMYKLSTLPTQPTEDNEITSLGW